MANKLKFFMAPEDEVAFLRNLERYKLEVYPRRVPPDWQPFAATAANYDKLPPAELYLAIPHLGNVLVDKVKRGPDKGQWRVDEVKSPVIFWGRCVRNEDDELLHGQLWGELDITPQTGRVNAAPEQFRALFMEIEGWLRKTYRKGVPKEFHVGPRCARLVKEKALVLRVDEHSGGTVGVQ
jgi:hypothetical protein